METAKLSLPVLSEVEVAPDVWTALEKELIRLNARIEAGEALEPSDVTNARALKKQVDDYVTTFNRRMRSAEKTYKQMVADRLEELGYGKLQAYIEKQREKQVAEQNAKIREKQTALKNLVETAVSQSVYVKDSALAGELLPAFTVRFPNVSSGAKNKDIKDWAPYKAMVENTIRLYDAFLSESNAVSYSPASKTVANLIGYAKDGDLARLTEAKKIYAEEEQLKKEWSPEAVVKKMKAALDSNTSAEEQIAQIRELLGKIIY